MKRFVIIYKDLLGPGGIPYETRALMSGLAAEGIQLLALCNLSGINNLDIGTKIINTFNRGDDKEINTLERYGITSLIRALMDANGTSSTYLLIGCRRFEYLIFAVLLRIKRVQCCVFVHGLLTSELLQRGWGGRPKGKVRRFVEICFNQFVDRPLLRIASVSRALSSTEADRLYKLGAKRVFEVADGVDKDWLSQEPVLNQPYNDKLVLLYLGRPEAYQKGLDLLMSATLEVSRSYSVELILAGPDVDLFQQIVLDACGEIPDWVKFTGMVSGEPKAKLFTEADFFVHVSRFEGMAKSVREAVGQGLPVIASYESNFGDWVEHHSMGFATVATFESIRDVILQAAELPNEERTRMRNEAWRFASEQTWQRVASTVISESAAAQ
jgi:glycosyltransferase involved in cell wall biosynthesis